MDINWNKFWWINMYFAMIFIWKMMMMNLLVIENEVQDNSHYKISQFYQRTNSVGVWLEVRRWFFYRRHHRRITSVGFPFVGDSPFRRYIGRKNKKTICWWFYKRNLRTKKKDSRLKYTDGFLFRRWYCNWPTETIRR